MMDVTLSAIHPRFRGRLHQAAFFAAIPAGIVLVAVAHSTGIRVAAIVYAISLVGLYGVSAAYHRRPWSPRSLQWMKRADHSMIFVLIAGTTTPVALFALHKPWSWIVLAAVWLGAALGIALKIHNVEGSRGLTGTLYIALGWLVVIQAPQLVRDLGPAALFLVVAGGLIYMVGAIVLLRHKPDPSPAVFGYKEIWHAMVIGGSACHYAAILLIVLSARAVTNVG
jgi:hemolysin III